MPSHQHPTMMPFVRSHCHHYLNTFIACCLSGLASPDQPCWLVEKNVIQPKQLRGFLAGDIQRTMPFTRLTMSRFNSSKRGKTCGRHEKMYLVYPFQLSENTIRYLHVLFTAVLLCTFGINLFLATDFLCNFLL